MSDLERVLKFIEERPRADVPEPEYVCAECNDTGLIEVFDGINNEGKRVSAPVILYCDAAVHHPKRAKSEQFEPRTRGFS